MKRLILYFLCIVSVYNCNKKNPVPSEKLYSVEGIILEANVPFTTPVSNAIVKINETADTTLADGKYIIQNLSKGTYKLEVSHPKFAPFDTSITIDKDLKQNFKIGQIISVSGEIREKTQIGFIPIQRALVKIGDHQSYSDSNGKYSIDNLTKGNYELKITSSTHETFDSTLTINNDTTLNFYLTRHYSIKGTISENSIFAKMPIENAIVQIGDIKDTTNSLGLYQIYLKMIGSYQIEISHPLYMSLDSTIFIESDSTFNYTLSPQIGDYFPLEIGREVNYQYRKWNFTGGGLEGVEYKGTKSWKIIEQTNNNGATVYSVLDIFNGIKISKYNFPYDTTYFESDSSYFTISEAVDHNVQIELFPISPQSNEYYISKIGRYSPITVGDTLEVWGDYGFSRNIFVKDIGLQHFYCEIGTSHRPKGWELIFINSN